MAELPELVKLQEEYRDQGVRVVLVSLDLVTGGKDDAKKVQRFLEKKEVPLDSVVYTGELATLQTTWGIGNALPYSMTIAKDGQLADGQTGAPGHARFVAMIEKALNW